MKYSQEDYLNLFIIYAECDRVLSSTWDTITSQFPETITKYYQENYTKKQEFWDVRARIQRKITNK